MPVDTRVLADRWPLLAALILLPLTLLCSLLYGDQPITLAELWRALNLQQPDSLASQLVWNLRLPRSLLAMVAGAHFALSGLILQAVLRNPLADPGVIGISAGASLAVIILLLIGVPTGLLMMALPVVALAGGLLACAVVLLLAWHSQLQPVLVALYGVALAATLNGAVMWVVISQGQGQTELAVLWLAGTLYGRDFSQLQLLLPWTAIAVLTLPLLLRPLQLMRFDEDIARSCGLALRRWRLLALLLAVMLAASAVAVTGPIGFIGLLVPHLAGLLCRRHPARLVPLTLCGGALLLLLADMTGRLLMPPLELPAGAISAMLGVPLFIYLLQRTGTLNR